MKPLLLERWPETALPHAALGTWPTPFRPLEVPGVPAGRLWVKDEGRSAEGYGGNKVRKLEPLLGAALARGAREVVTAGTVGSHHVVATAFHARRLGLGTYAVLGPQPDDPHARRQARLIDAWCEGWFAASRVAGLPFAAARAWVAIRVLGGTRPMPVAVGGSEPLGTAGAVSLGLEIASQAAAEGVAPRRVYVALGSGGTAAGLWIGLRLAGLGTEVVGVRVAPRVVANARRVRALVRRTVALLRAHGLPPVPLAPGGLRVVHGWVAGGYGRTDDRVREILRRAPDLGLSLDATYTAKALGACLEEVRRDPAPAVFVATLNDRPLDALLDEALPEVPEALARLLVPPGRLRGREGPSAAREPPPRR